VGACARYRTGSPIWNAAPLADGTSAIVPPWATISARTMARPGPVPPRSRAVVTSFPPTRTDEAIDRARAAVGEDAKYDLDVR